MNNLLIKYCCRITSYNVCYTKLLRLIESYTSLQNFDVVKAHILEFESAIEIAKNKDDTWQLHRLRNNFV